MGKGVSKILLIRIAAWGDCLGITPLIRYLAEKGKEVYVLTKETGEQIFKHNPFIKKLILYKDELSKIFPNLKGDIPNDKLSRFFKAVAQAYEIDRTIDLCEAWEVKIARHPAEPSFQYPKNKAKEFCDINYYEQIFKLADEPYPDNLLPEMFFAKEEEDFMDKEFQEFREQGKVIMWGLSGSAANKTYPYVPEVIFSILKKHKDICFLTVGDEVCRILEFELTPDYYNIDTEKKELCKLIFRRSGKWTMRQSSLATKYADLVIAPDTGLLHASGMYDTPKIGLLNHTSKNNIVKHFKNNFSIHCKDNRHPVWGKITCAPCYKIIYDKRVTCNLMRVKETDVPVCMGTLYPQRVIQRIEEVLGELENLKKTEKLEKLKKSEKSDELPALQETSISVH